ncbi:copper chaperone PCu(A)C [Kaustia mangrovi]|uniref:Copper chaperone PCu(A)C n=1 Tax=Kaustia mangrovi TaxID=2593653 RepID=A0A7S8HAC9_9HYPH|nr:copper chaperone PCu(A)C [Kaustia mangrovi]QPC41311.1 copper chaperone PCu(A)C [Kaustia mangrovi]
MVVQFALAAALTAGGFVAWAHQFTRSSLQIDHPWARPLQGKEGAGAGYLSITNAGGVADRLTGGESRAARAVELRPAPAGPDSPARSDTGHGVEIAPGATVALKPGGTYLEFLGLKATFAQRTEIPVTLHFRRAGAVEITMPVEGRPARASDAAAR